MWRFMALVCVTAACGRLDFETVAVVVPTDATDAATDTLDAPAVVLPAPVGWWKLDETTGTMAADSSGNMLTGTLSGGATWTGGHTGNGIGLNGTMQYIQVGDDSGLRLSGSWTLSLWLKLTAAPANTEMYTLAAKTDSMGYETYSLRIDNNYGQFGATGPGSFIAQFATAAGTDVYATYKPVGIDTGVWMSIAGTWDAGTGVLVLYVNGQPQGSVIDLADTPTTLAGQPFLIGDNAGHLDQGVRGVIDDVRLYNVALTQDEVATIFAGH